MEAPTKTTTTIDQQTALAAAVPATQAAASNLYITPEERAFLMEHGYLVKLNVIPETECERLQTSFEEVLKTVNPKASSVSPQRWAKEDLPASLHGIQEVLKLAHLPCIKDVRMHPNVVAVWRSLLRTDEITTSWDRVNYMPIGYTDGARIWHHTDVGPEYFKRGDVGNYYPTQSYVQVSRTSTNDVRVLPLGNAPTADPCIVLWEYSNLAHAEYFRRKGPHFKLRTPNWYIYNEATIAEWEKDGRAYLPASHPAKRAAAPFPMRRLEVRAPRGAMVFWLSTTAHMNTAGTCPNPRFVVYVCYGPSILLTKDDRERIWTAIREQRCTSHWPCAGATKLFPVVPPHFSKEKAAEFREMMEHLHVPQLTFTASELTLLPKQPSH